MSNVSPLKNYWVQFRENEKFKNECSVILNARILNLNKCGSKYIGVGLSANFEPCVKIGGNKGFITLAENEWKLLLDYQGCILNHFYSQGDCMDVIEFEGVKIFFEELDLQGDTVRLTKFFKNNHFVYLGLETVCNLWQLLPLINNRIDALKKQQFGKYFNTFRTSLTRDYGDMVNTVFNVLMSRNNQCNENDSTMMELVLLYPNLLEEKLKL